MARLTPKSVEDAKPMRSKRQEIPDDGSTGLYLIIQPSGAKSWSVRYRFDGKPRKYTIGRYPLISLKDARLTAAEVVHQVSTGEDPAAKKAAAKAPTVADFVSVRDAFDQYATRRLPKLKSGHHYESSIRLHVLPMLGDRDIKSIAIKDIRDMRSDIVEDDHITAANRTKAYFSAMLSWCVEEGMIEMNPALSIKNLAGEESRERVLDDDELRSLMKACRSMKGPWGDFTLVLLMTGQRLREISMMTTKELKGDTLTLNKARTKNSVTHDVPFPPAVIEILERRPCVPIKGKGFAYYFSTTVKTPISGFSKGRKALKTRMPGCDHWTFHDLRRTLATRLEGMGVSQQVTEAILNHVSGSKSGVAGIYQRHKYVREKREALLAWSAELERIERDV